MSTRTLPGRKALAGISLVGAGLLAGGTMAVVGTADAADSPTATIDDGTPGNEDRRGGSGETALTGDALEKVKAAVLASYAGATFDRVETDSDGVYEAHIVTAAGGRLTVEVDAGFAVTGTE